jgi:uncharacterized protein (TIGR03000 family)
MYSMVIMMTMAAAPDTAACGGKRGGGCHGGGYGGGYGNYYGGCYGGGRSYYGGGGCSGGYYSGGGYSSGYSPYYGGYANGTVYSGGYYSYSDGTPVISNGTIYSNGTPMVANETIYPNRVGTGSTIIDGRVYPGGTTVSRSSPINASTAAATVRVTMPADAKLFFDSTPTSTQSETREFITPPIPTDANSTYTLTATLTRDQKQVKAEKHVTVRGGQLTEVNFDPASFK